MAYQIVRHRIIRPREYAVYFKCGCGCEFWADESSFNEYCIRGVNVIGNPYYKAKCPECDSRVYSVEPPVPKRGAFAK